MKKSEQPQALHPFEDLLLDAYLGRIEDKEIKLKPRGPKDDPLERFELFGQLYKAEDVPLLAVMGASLDGPSFVPVLEELAEGHLAESTASGAVADLLLLEYQDALPDYEGGRRLWHFGRVEEVPRFESHVLFEIDWAEHMFSGSPEQYRLTRAPKHDRWFLTISIDAGETDFSLGSDGVMADFEAPDLQDATAQALIVVSEYWLKGATEWDQQRPEQLTNVGLLTAETYELLERVVFDELRTLEPADLAGLPSS